MPAGLIKKEPSLRYASLGEIRIWKGMHNCWFDAIEIRVRQVFTAQIIIISHQHHNRWLRGYNISNLISGKAASGPKKCGQPTNQDTNWRQGPRIPDSERWLSLFNPRRPTGGCFLPAERMGGSAVNGGGWLGVGWLHRWVAYRVAESNPRFLFFFFCSPYSDFRNHPWQQFCVPCPSQLICAALSFARHRALSLQPSRSHSFDLRTHH